MRRKRAELIKKGKLPSTFVDAREVRQRLAALARRGLGSRQVAELAGVDRGAVMRARRGKGRVARRVAERILSIPLTADPAAGQLVDAGPSWERIAKILEAGYSKAWIARRVTGNPAAKSLKLGREQVTVAHERAAQAAYDEVFWRPAPAARVPGSSPVFTVASELLGERGPKWMDDGACRSPEHPQRIFFPGRGDPTAPGKAVCRSCPVVEECLDYALSKPERFGIWGGLSEAERRQIRGEPDDEDVEEAG
jgi:WhiB family redox-sensing transcriptional regulator